MPLALRCPRRIKAGTPVLPFVSPAALARTLLDAAGAGPLHAAAGRSLLPLLAGAREKQRDAAFFERERHANVRKGDLSYPARGVRTGEFLYIRNYRPERWPAGDPELHFAV